MKLTEQQLASGADVPQDTERYFPPEYEVWQDDLPVASSSGHRPDAIREILHYAAQYQQDGPVRIFEVRRQLCSADELAFALNGLTEAETTASASVAWLKGGEPSKQCACSGIIRHSDIGGFAACSHYRVGGGCTSESNCEHQQPSGQEGGEK